MPLIIEEVVKTTRTFRVSIDRDDIAAILIKAVSEQYPNELPKADELCIEWDMDVSREEPNSVCVYAIKQNETETIDERD